MNFTFNYLFKELNMNTEQKLAVATLVFAVVGCVVGSVTAYKTRQIAKRSQAELKSFIDATDARLASYKKN